MTKEFDPNKPVQTRSGHKARIICTDRVGLNYPIIALVREKDGSEGLCSFTKNGESSLGEVSDLDLINVLVKQVRWANVYAYPQGPFYVGHLYIKKEAAEAIPRGESFKGLAKIEWEE